MASSGQTQLATASDRSVPHPTAPRDLGATVSHPPPSAPPCPFPLPCFNATCRCLGTGGRFGGCPGPEGGQGVTWWWPMVMSPLQCVLVISACVQPPSYRWAGPWWLQHGGGSPTPLLGYSPWVPVLGRQGQEWALQQAAVFEDRLARVGTGPGMQGSPLWLCHQPGLSDKFQGFLFPSILGPWDLASFTKRVAQSPDADLGPRRAGLLRGKGPSPSFPWSHWSSCDPRSLAETHRGRPHTCPGISGLWAGQEVVGSSAQLYASPAPLSSPGPA